MNGFRMAMLAAVVGMAVMNAGTRALSANATAEEAEVLRLREAAWRAWFGGDEGALRRILPTDFIGISAKAGPLATLDVAVEQSRAFHAAGGRLISLQFPETRFQHYGAVTIIYGTYSAVIESGGKTSTSQGRLTEMFLRRGSTWVHTGWHLDSVAPAAE